MENWRIHKYVEVKQHTLNNQWVQEEIKRKIRKYLETNENKNTIDQNLWDLAKAVLRGKFITINAYIKKKTDLPIDIILSSESFIVLPFIFGHLVYLN